MPNTPREFKGDMARFSALLLRRLARSGAAIGAVIRHDVALRTPFDTGRAAASWNASLNGPNTRVQPDEVSFGSISAAAQAGEVNLQGVRPGDSIHISNSLHYIGKLNAGHSQQAPANFVEMTVQVVARQKAGTIIANIAKTTR